MKTQSTWWWPLVLLSLATACGSLVIERPPTVWVPSPHHRKGERTRSSVDSIAIHTTEGAYNEDLSHEENQLNNYLGTIGYFEQNDRNVSSHFLLGPDGEITEMVAEGDIAHTTTYYNARSFGIECAGWSSRVETWTPQLLNSLIELCAFLCVKWDIPVVHPDGTARTGPHTTQTDDPERPRFDAPGIVGHFQVQPWNKTDPGPHFPWDEFMTSLKRRVGGLRELLVEPLQPRIVSRQAWGAAPGREETMRTHVVERVTLHHSGVDVPDWPQVDGAAWMQHLQKFSLEDRPWGDVPYHFCVTPDGTIYRGRELRFAGDTNTSYDPAGHLLIEAVGNFENDELPPAQLQALVELCAWASVRYGAPLAQTSGHRDHASTACPGADLYAYLTSGKLVDLVRAELAAAGIDDQGLAR